MKVAWTFEARADRHAIYDFIEKDNPSAALALDELILERTIQLTTYPMLGRPGRVSSTRELVVHPNYILIYDIGSNTIRIIRILHAAQQWPPEATSST